MRSQTVVFLAFTLFLGAISTPALAAEPGAKERVLVMRVEGTDLSDKDKSDLFEVIQLKLSKYPSKEIVQPSAAAIDDQMMEFECFDIDAECLAKLGKAQSADVIVFVQVDGNDKGFALIARAIRVEGGRVLHDKSVQLRSKADLSARLDSVLSRVFGPPPKPKVTKGRLVIKSKTPAARIFVNGKYSGSGRIRLKKEEGTYDIRVAKDGFFEELITIEVTAGATTEKVVTLKPMPKPVASVAPIAPPPEEKASAPTPWYKTWWFFTAVSVVSIGTTAAIIATSDADDPAPEPGRVFVTIDGGEAWLDPAIATAGGAP